MLEKDIHIRRTMYTDFWLKMYLPLNNKNILNKHCKITIYGSIFFVCIFFLSCVFLCFVFNSTYFRDNSNNINETLMSIIYFYEFWASFTCCWLLFCSVWSRISPQPNHVWRTWEQALSRHRYLGILISLSYHLPPWIRPWRIVNP